MIQNNSNNVVEKTGKTIDEAIAQALSDFGVGIDRINYEILEQPNKGLFGFIGSKLAKVRVTLIKNDPAEVAEEFLKNVFEALNIEAKIEVSKIENETVVSKYTKDTNDDYKSKRALEKNKDFLLINLRGSDLGTLIGKHGQTLDSLQYLTNIVANKESLERVKIVLDIEDYRKRREETLKRLAMRLADKVKHYREKIALEPMNSQERKIIHMTLQNDSRIITYSEGEEPFRRVVIALKR